MTETEYHLKVCAFELGVIAALLYERAHKGKEEEDNWTDPVNKVCQRVLGEINYLMSLNK